MPSRKSVYPSSNRRDREPDIRGQSRFLGVFEDEEPTNVPREHLQKAINAHAHGHYASSRNGSLKWTFSWPNIEGREGYSAHKDGDIIVSDSGPIFSEDDVSNLWGWDNGLFDVMIEYVSPTRMRCADNDANTGTACFVRGKPNLLEWHSKKAKFIAQRGQDLYVGTANFTTRRVSFQKVCVFSVDLPNNTVSDFSEDGDYALVQNSAGMFRVIMDDDVPRAYALNTPIQNRRPTSTTTGEKKSKYRYVTTMTLLDSDGNAMDRETAGVKILTESGSNTIDSNRRDWAEINTEEPIDDGEATYGVLDGSSLADRDAATWEAITDAVYQVNINNLGYQQIVSDFSGVTTMYEVAQIIQEDIRTYFPTATVEYISQGLYTRFRVTSGRIGGGVIAHFRNGADGTNIAGMLGLRLSDGARITNPPIGQPNVLYDVYYPSVRGSTRAHQHWNVVSVYRTADIGPAGYSDAERKGSLLYSHLNETGKRVVNSPDQLIWVKDVRVAGAFVARMIQGYIEVQKGELSQDDVGNPMEFEDGTRVTITAVESSKLAVYDTGPYYTSSSPWMGACIGNGRVARASQTGNIVTRHAGTLFYEEDERKPILWPTGQRSYIKKCLGSGRFEVYDSVERPETAFTMDWTWRNINDYTNDEDLFSHASGWMLQSRFMEPMARGNLITKIPGFLLSAAEGQKTVNYCHLEASYRPHVGYHVEVYQKIELEDKIMSLWAFPQRFTIFCQSQIHTGVTNTSRILTIEGTQQIVVILSGVDKKADIGLAHKGSLRKISKYWVRFVTNTGEIREFNGEELSEDYAVSNEGLGRFSKAITKAYPEFASLFTLNNGYLIWWRE